MTHLRNKFGNIYKYELNAKFGNKEAKNNNSDGEIKVPYSNWKDFDESWRLQKMDEIKNTVKKFVDQNDNTTEENAPIDPS